MNSTVVRLGLVSLFADISSEMLYPITPIFLTTVLGASMTSVGFIEGLAEAIASLLKTYSGVWSDRIRKRKIFIWLGYLLSAFSKPLIGSAHAWSSVLFARSLDRVGKGLRTAPRDALIADTVNEKQRGAAFGLHRAMDTFGAAIGPLLTIWYLSENDNNLRNIYYWSIIPGIFAVVIALTVKESLKKNLVTKRTHEKIKWKSLPKQFRNYLIGWGVFSISNSSDVFLLLKAKESGCTSTTVILIYCFYNLIYSIASPGLGHLSDRIGRKKCLIFGLLVFASVYFCFSLTLQPWHFWILFGVYGLYMAATDGVGKALAIDLMSEDYKATAIGLLGTVSGLTTIVASSVAGLLWDSVSPQAPFLFAVIGSLLSCLVILRIRTT